jgi:hypothetical protein
MTTDPPGFSEVVARLRALLDAEYRRGQAEAARRIIEAAQTEVSPATTPVAIGVPIKTMANGHAERRKAAAPRKRAPAGAPDSLLQRVLTERGRSGTTANEILGAAHPGDERLVSLSGIRFAFERGKRAGIYKSDGRRWFLADMAPKPPDLVAMFSKGEEAKN